MNGQYLYRRGDYWHYKRRVPITVRTQDHRDIVRISTKKKDHREALIVASEISTQLEAYWATLEAGGDPGSAQSFANAVARARALGVVYLTGAEATLFALLFAMNQESASR